MRVQIDARFQDERDRFAFHFSCEDCVYFDAGGARCAHGYPVAPHRAEAFAPEGAGEGMFCKEFELV